MLSKRAFRLTFECENSCDGEPTRFRHYSVLKLIDRWRIDVVAISDKRLGQAGIVAMLLSLLYAALTTTLHG